MVSDTGLWTLSEAGTRKVADDMGRRIHMGACVGQHRDEFLVEAIVFIGKITSFGLVSMFVDIVYEGALAVQDPLLLSLGASAALVGLISGLGEVTSLAGRLFTGPAAGRTSRYWLFAIASYAITALAVPAMGLVGSVVAAAALIIIERLGKAVRTPSRDAMLSHASSAVGRGKGFDCMKPSTR